MVCRRAFRVAFRTACRLMLEIRSKRIVNHSIVGSGNKPFGKELGFSGDLVLLTVSVCDLSLSGRSVLGDDIELSC